MIDLISHPLHEKLKALIKYVKHKDLNAYLYGDISCYLYSKDVTFLREHIIDIIISGDIDIEDFYQSIKDSVVINKEIENSDSIYFFISKPYYIKLRIDKNFDVHNASNISKYCDVTVESLFYDLKNRQFIDPTDNAISDIDSKTIRTINSFDQNNLGDVVAVATAYGKYLQYQLDNNIVINPNCYIQHLREPLDLLLDDAIQDILLTTQPGNALKFIGDNFIDGEPWLFMQITNYLLMLDIPLNEESTISKVFNTKKIDLLNTYNDFFLSGKEDPETVAEKQRRLTTSLRVLFDSPSIEIPTPYIEQISVLNIEEESEKNIRSFQENYECEYGECPECIPSECAQEPNGSACCCCHKINYIEFAQNRCHKQTVISCDKTGTKPGPNLDPFPSFCEACLEACDMALEKNGKMCEDIWGGGGDPPPEWWQLPPEAAPCECTCAEGFWSGGCEGCGDCELTCVHCNNFCKSDITEEPGDCSFRLKLTPGDGCCGVNPFVDFMFAIDVSGSMGPIIDNIREEIDTLFSRINTFGSKLRVGLVTFGQINQDGSPELKLPLTEDLDAFKDILANIDPDGSTEPDIWAAHVAATQGEFGDGQSNYVIIIGDEASQLPLNTPTLQDTIDVFNLIGVVAISISEPSAPAVERDALANATGGQLFDIQSFATIVDELNLTSFPTDCNCQDFTPIYIKNADTGEIDLPINKCVKDDLSDCDCTLPFPLDVCGNIVIVEPEELNMVCCHTLGCDCPSDPCDIDGCCGPPDFGVSCPGIDVCSWPNVEAAIDGVWCNCFFDPDNVVINPGICIDCCCPDTSGPECECEECCNCCIQVPDGNCEFDEVCRSQVEEAVRSVWEKCDRQVDPPPDWDCANTNCEREDECIVGTPSGPLSDPQCDQAHVGCSSVKHPSVVVLNNGIGLVAYESFDNNSVIKIQQFHSSAISKILPNREFNHGRLEHSSKWRTNLNIARLYYFDEDLPVHFLTGITEPSEPSIWKDAVAFKNGPLQNRCFPLYATEGEVPYGSDSVGNYIQFIVQDTNLSNPFPSFDDVYNVRWFIYNREDEGLIGDVPTEGDIPGKDFLIESRDVVDQSLQLPPHIYNGQQVPVAYPNIATAYNYMNSLENSHFIYVAYQALEDSKWNIYLRQIRLSEYEKEEQIDEASFTNIVDLGILEVTYRVVCTNDDCNQFDNSFILTRSITMEVMLPDGREVYNNGFVGNWPSLCPGMTNLEFPKQKVFVQLTHSVTADRCPDQFGFDDIFYNWQTGNEFVVPAIPMSADALFFLIQSEGDSAVELGSFSPAKSIGGANVTSSQVGAVWYDPIDTSEWTVLESTDFEQLSKYKGLNIDQPILLTENDTGHATHPVVKVNYNNDVFVAYESTESDIQQIQLIGTSVPSSSLPSGIFVPQRIDENLDYFLKPTDFIYQNAITQFSDKTNRLPDLFIDFNDVIHLTWQSNKDNRWEIYYARLDQNFSPKRITDHRGRSLKPKIDGDENGRIYITWHDDRFNNWEIMLAYFDGSRILPLSQQDPYLASSRNFDLGWKHSTGLIPLDLSNNEFESKCFTNITVSFYEDRLLTNLAFRVSQDDWPFAFTVDGATDDTTSEFFDRFTDWSLETDDTNPSVGVVVTITSPEFNTGLFSSIVSSITPVIVGPKGYVKIAFRSSDIENDVSANAQWTDFASITTLSGEVNYSDLNLVESSGRYKQIRLEYIDDQSTYIESPVISINIKSVIKSRICIGPNSSLTAFLDLTPEVRVDKLGNETVETPIPVGFLRNNTYFVSHTAIDEDGQLVTFPDPKQSVSCEACTGEVASWNFTSCSLLVDVVNDTENTRFYNARVRFFTDPDKVNQIMQFDAFPNGNLDCFTVDNNISADLAWTERGLRVPPNNRLDLVLWPFLSNTSGLLCNINYYVDVSVCYIEESEATVVCDPAALEIQSFQPWRCDCQSMRWDTRFEDAPINMRDVIRWRSSGDGFSDTRLTETIGSDNLNPSIKVRSNLDGIVIYESNRESPENNAHKVYASVFSVVPATNMYATGSEAITSPFDQVLVRSDIPICEDGGCVSPEGETRLLPTLEGRNVSLDIDQYDNIFIASEVSLDSSQCAEFITDKQQIVKVHRCGANAENLFFGHEQEDLGDGECASDAIIKTLAPTEENLLRSIIKQVRVKNESVSYHITRNDKPVAVVNDCNVILEIIGTPEVIAVRLRNEASRDWSTWYPFDTESGNNTMEVPWLLTSANGVKSVDVQVATYQGLTESFNLTVVADYHRVGFNVDFYKLPTDSDIKPPDEVDITNNSLFLEENLLNRIEGIPVAATREPIFSVDTGLVLRKNDYILVQISVEKSYLDMFTQEQKDNGEADITFDFIHQGSNDQFALRAKYIIAEESFRGTITINTEDSGLHKDGLAFIIPHFKNDCFNRGVEFSTELYNKDKYNLVIQGMPDLDAQADIWAAERDEFGAIKHKITLRPDEDPYFVFGDPNYRLKQPDS